MFIKNPSSIKRKILKVNDDEKKYLMQLGYNPVSKDNDKWIFFSNKDILSLLKNIRMEVKIKYGKINFFCSE
jgi:hypothetical protein